MGEQRVPLLQVESDREASETVYRQSSFLGHFEVEAAALGQNETRSEGLQTEDDTPVIDGLSGPRDEYGARRFSNSSILLNNGG